MAKFTYTGDETRFYQDLELVVNPGDTVDLPDMPADGRWTASAAPTPAPTPAPEAPQTAPEAVSAPSADAPASTPTDK